MGVFEAHVTIDWLTASGGVAPTSPGATLRLMPTARPRYTFTDTGHLGQLLDAAARRWPEITNRKGLLLRLAEEGSKAVDSADEQLAVEERRKRARAALGRIPALVDAELLLSDRAWN